jgi:hypothetical protein
MREMDIQVAILVFGFDAGKNALGQPVINGRCICPDFSTEISDAWMVVDKMKEDGWYIDIGNYREWFVSFTRQPEDDSFAGSGETAPEAICRAALEALEKS